MSGAKFLDTAYQEANVKLDDKNFNEVIAGINVTARSSTTLQSASGHCWAKTRRSDVADQQMTTNPQK